MLGHRLTVDREEPGRGATPRICARVIDRARMFEQSWRGLDQPARDAARIELLERFLDQHSPEIVLVVLAEEDARGRVPAEAYDELYDAGDVAAVVRRIRLQEPGGIIRPFPKPRSGAGL